MDRGGNTCGPNPTLPAPSTGIPTTHSVRPIRTDEPGGDLSTIRWVAAADVQGWLRIWEIDSGHLIQSIHVSETPIVAIAFSSEGKRLMTLASLERTLRVWSWADGSRLETLAELSSPGNAIACSPDGSLIAVPCADGAAALLDSSSGQRQGEIRACRPMCAVVFSP